jgi:hypothetical protein
MNRTDAATSSSSIASMSDDARVTTPIGGSVYCFSATSRPDKS